MALDVMGSTDAPSGRSRILHGWSGTSACLMAGVFLGLVLLVGMAASLTRGGSSAPAIAGVVTNNVVHIDGRQIGNSCWRGADEDGPARLTVALEVGLDGKVRNAVAAGESQAMRGCVEAHVKAWEFLPQATLSTLVLPFEIAQR